MPRMSLLGGSVALLAIYGVNAGPCRPLSSVITSGLEIATTSTEVSESTATLASTSTTEIEVSETLSTTVSTTEGITTETSAETTAITVDTTTAEATTTEDATTTEAAITTEAPTTPAETTTSLATTSAEPIPQPRHDCSDLGSRYDAPNGDVFNIACNSSLLSYVFLENTRPGNFEACLLQCAASSVCSGVKWDKSISSCITFMAPVGIRSDASFDIAYKA